LELALLMTSLILVAQLSLDIVVVVFSIFG